MDDGDQRMCAVYAFDKDGVIPRKITQPASGNALF
jgi:hypothetical protein